ncbi:MAG: DUF4843 domain-containing protein [Bacteroidetes bacterium]|nr:DUF4843 domain-containing protein [Bacteroidota bacterium]
MKKNILISLSLVLGVLLYSCQKANEMKYIGVTNAVFGTTSDTLTPIVYSFLEHPTVKDVDTIYVPVRIQGNRAPIDRQIKISVVKDSTTAVVGKHYEALKDQYVMPKDSGSIKVPVIIKKGDNQLNISTVKIGLRIEANASFGSNPRYQYTSVTFSNTLKKPTWWTYWESNLPKFTTTAYSLVTKITGRTNFSSTPDGSPLFYVSIYAMTSVWNPFFTSTSSDVQTLTTWVSNHPEWVLTKHTSDNNYDFYQSSDPSTKFRYGIVSSGSTIYGFFDETGAVMVK